MGFRALVAGGRGRVEYTRLRDALDRALTKRLPDVGIVTGGPSVPALAASYARSRGLPVTVVRADHEEHRADAENRQVGRLAELADAAVVIDDGAAGGEVVRLLTMLQARGGPVLVLGRPEPAGKPAEPSPPPPRLRGLPD
jgi:hypothetical protein